MKRVNLLRMSLQSVNLVLLLALIAGGHALSATTLVVGNCKAGGYSTIQAAVNAAPAGATVQVCPGGYWEQVSITRAVTLEGITSNNQQGINIYPPAAGLVPNATDAFGRAVAAQVLVQNSTGAVNISNIIVFGQGNGISGCPPAVAGIMYQNSSGAIKRVTTLAQIANQCGLGIWVEGGTSNPSVTVEENNVIDFDYTGIYAETIYHANSELTATITANYVRGFSAIHLAGIWIDSGSTSTVTGNMVFGNNSPPGYSDYGLLVGPYTAGSVSTNTVQEVNEGILTVADAVPITSNKFLNTYSVGIEVKTPVGAIKSNYIVGANYRTSGIYFDCNANPNVSSNTISFVGNAIAYVPSGVTTNNSYFNVETIRASGC